MEEAQEDVASVGSVAINLLCCLLGQAAHHTLYPVYRMVGNKGDKYYDFISHNQKSLQGGITKSAFVFKLLHLFS